MILSSVGGKLIEKKDVSSKAESKYAQALQVILKEVMLHRSRRIGIASSVFLVLLLSIINVEARRVTW